MSDPQSPISQEEYEYILAQYPHRERLGIPIDRERVRAAFHPFSPERVMVLTPKMLRASSKRVRSVGEHIRTSVEERRSDPLSPLTMSSEKFDLLVLLIDRMANHYGRPELVVEWATRLVLREILGSSWLGPGFGLVHQFQALFVPDENIIVSNSPVDWWLILFPEGGDYQSCDENPNYVLIGHVFDHCPHLLHLEVWSLTHKFLREVQKAHQMVTIAQMDRVAATRLLNYRLALLLKGEPEE